MYKPTIFDVKRRRVPVWHKSEVSAQSMVNSRDVPKVGKSAKGSGPRKASTYRGKRRNARRVMRAEQLASKRGEAYGQ
jgi:hypothetical protein